MWVDKRENSIPSRRSAKAGGPQLSFLRRIKGDSDVCDMQVDLCVGIEVEGLYVPQKRLPVRSEAQCSR